MSKIVIIGSGAAAVSAIKAIRDIDKQSDILLFSEENYHPYYRIKISKGLLGGLEEEKILIQKKEWYALNNVKLHLNQKVLSIVPEEKQITLDDGSSVTYSKLLLANGASNFIPSIKGIDKQGVFTLRALKGAMDAIEYLKDSNTVLLIGGGVQNLETAHILSKSGKKVIIAEFAKRLMPRQLDELSSGRLKQNIEAQGVEVILDTEIGEILGKERVEGFITKSGVKRSCDMVIYSTGITPNIQIAKDTPLDINRGVIVNERMETSIPDIFAAGDISEFNGKVYGLWGIATQQGKIAGANISGQHLTFEPPAPVTMMDAFGLSIYSVGDIEENPDTHVLTELDNENNKYFKLFICGKHVKGAIVIGDLKKFMTLKGFIENKLEFDFDKVLNHSVDEFIEMLKNAKKAS